MVLILGLPYGKQETLVKYDGYDVIIFVAKMSHPV